jgi:Ring finger domain
VSNEKKNRKKRKKLLSGSDQNEDDDEMPMDAVEIPGVSTAGTVDSLDNHNNLSPTDNYGDVESASASAVAVSPATSTVATSPNSSQPTSPASSRSRTNKGGSSDDVYSSPNYDEHSDLGSEDHMDQRPRNASTSDDESSGKGLKKAESFDTDDEPDDDMVTGSSFVFEMDDGAPKTPHLQDNNNTDREREVNLPMTHYLKPNLSSGGASKSFDETEESRGGSFEVHWGAALSSSPSLVDPKQMPSTDTLSDDDEASNDARDARRALFRDELENVDASATSAETGIAKNTASNERATEESKEEISATEDIPAIEHTASNESFGDFVDYLSASMLRVPVPITRRESFTTVTSEYTYDDDSTGDNVCPICLSGYKKGDILVVSKHCTHCFHKDCILEWLEKHDDCPICRINMVTDSEMSRAATSLVGKTRMYRAVASLQTSSSSPANQRYRTHPHPQAAAANAVSPFAGTIRQSARTRTPRGYQNARAFS